MNIEQTLTRVFRTMEGIINTSRGQTKNIYLSNGTIITAISGDYAGAAGSNNGVIISKLGFGLMR